MRRRTLLGAGVAGLGATLFGRVAAHEKPSGGGTDHDHGGTGEGGERTAHPEGFEPLDVLDLQGAKELVVDGDVAYVAATDGFATVDVADPSDLSILAERRGLLSDHPAGPLGQIYDGKVGDDLYAVGGPANPTDEDVVHAAVVFDVSDPAAPEKVLVHETSYYHHNLDVADGTLYLCGNDADRNPLVCIDVESGEELGRWSVVDEDPRWAEVHHSQRQLHDVWVDDGVAYCSYWDAGTWVVDVSDPTAPEAVTGLRPLDPEAQAAVEEGDPRHRARLGLPGNDHFAMPRRTDPAEVGGTDEPETGRPASRLLALNEEAWPVAGDEAAGEDDGDGADGEAATGDPGGVELWDPDEAERLARIEAPASPDPTFEGVWTTSHNFDFVGDRLYTSWYRGGVRVHDVSDPSDPRELAVWRDGETTSFWTAQRGPGGTLLASSWRDHSRETPQAGGAVYAFPDPVPADDDVEDGPSEGLGSGFGTVAGLAGVGLAALARRLTGERDR